MISREISNCPFSDHDFNIIKLKTNGIEMGPGSWIVNLNTTKFDCFKQLLLNGENYE